MPVAIAGAESDCIFDFRIRNVKPDNIIRIMFNARLATLQRTQYWVALKFVTDVCMWPAQPSCSLVLATHLRGNVGTGSPRRFLQQMCNAALILQLQLRTWGLKLRETQRHDIKHSAYLGVEAPGNQRPDIQK